LGSGRSISLMPSEKPPAGHEGAGAGRLFTLKTSIIFKRIKNHLNKLKSIDKNQQLESGEMSHHEVLAALAKDK
ncbi:5814_t:CDS:2, partial [Entrophospora sp. SA101]